MFTVHCEGRLYNVSSIIIVIFFVIIIVFNIFFFNYYYYYFVVVIISSNWSHGPVGRVFGPNHSPETFQADTITSVPSCVGVLFQKS